MQHHVASSSKNIIITAHTLDILNESDMVMETMVKVKGSLMNQGIESYFCNVISSKKVFESSDQMQGWDGTFKGEALPPDVYGFYLQVKCFNGDEFFKKGNIALLK